MGCPRVPRELTGVACVAASGYSVSAWLSASSSSWSWSVVGFGVLVVDGVEEGLDIVFLAADQPQDGLAVAVTVASSGCSSSHGSTPSIG